VLAVAAAGRELPWGRRAVVEVIVSLAVDPEDPDVRRLLETWTAAARPGQGPAARVIAALSAVSARLAQVEVRWQVDAAAVSVASGTRASLVLPLMLRLLPGEGLVSIAKAEADGAVTVYAGGKPTRLAPGEGTDLALVPVSGGAWAVDGRPWREAIVARLREGLAVARISVVNLGVSPASERPGFRKEEP